MGISVHKQSIDLNKDIDSDGTVRLNLPPWSEILTIAEQAAETGRLAVWYRCNPGLPSDCERTIHVVGTGHPCPPKVTARYISTVLLHGGSLVLHFFENGDA